MTTPTYEVKIVGVNENASHPSGQGALIDVVLDLKPSPDYEWSRMFDALWERHFYMMKRRAHSDGRDIVVTCIPDELADGLLGELKKVVAETNTAATSAAAAAYRRRFTESCS